MEVVPFTYQINGTASAYATLVPQIDLRVESLAGVYANVDPRVEVTGQATFSNGQLNSANWGIVADADLNIGLSVIGLDNDALPALPPFNLFRKEWSSVYPPPGQLTIRSQPTSREVVVGSAASFSVDAVSGQPIAYQWYFNAVPLAGQAGPNLNFNSVALGHAGQYYVRLTSGGQSVQSSTAALTVRAASTPSGMALIPAGSFTMGNCMDPGEGRSDELPVHTVYVSAFYMDKYLVTKGLWDTVKSWGVGNGYEYLTPESGVWGKASTHPVQTVGWYDVVKWCNARSQKEGLTPCYYTDSGVTTVYKTGWADPYVKWGANGYRLPTEAEWEKAARGGASGHRFPWSNVDTITHSQANYYSINSYAYDISPTRGYHPAFNDGVYPYTSPVGYFAANGYGLYDMAGNGLQWCWDWFDGAYYSSSPETDPRGPASRPGPGTPYRALRGGEWYVSADYARCAVRVCGDATGFSGNATFSGFRCVRGFSTLSGIADTTGPSLTISSPANGSSVTNSSVTCSGTASDSGRGNSGISSVTANGVRANNDTATGGGTANWSLTVLLSPGTNTIAVVATDGANNTTTNSITVTYNPPNPAGMALIPAGSFTMGDSLDGDGYALPLHTVYVSAFYMDKYEVTKVLWDTMYQWAIAHGYSYDNAGSGKASTHPVQSVNWYDVVKWCNARSEKEGLTPCYYTDSGWTAGYKTGRVAPYVKWTANGYRLPTEAEWEKAARGGASGHRFPWSDAETINWNRANYYASGFYSYDVNPTSGYNPAWTSGDYLYTTPVGSFAANAYGLYDMAGNAWEWCWDWFGWYSSGSQTNPRGPASGSDRVLRGGSWNDDADDARCAYRYYYYPTFAYIPSIGFRSVLPSGDTADTTAPSLTISSPADGSSVTNSSVTCSGMASDSGRGNSGISSVTANGVRASNDTATGGGTANWSLTVPLSPGANTITVVATDGANNTTINTITVTYNRPNPEGMALIPAGSFTMGDALDGDSSALPLHTVNVSAFYMDKYPVTKSLWDTVKGWNGGNGYSYDYAGSGKASTHPVQTIDWYDCVKWCNARSQKEGLTPAYYTDSGLTMVYKAGQVAPYVKWTANGYRLPTEAEWEKAAQGGASGQRFPWGNTISWSQANYDAYPLSAGGYAYDVNPTSGFHPTFATGGYPYTSPVGYFAANGYGLYDMAGNVWQWCWDWYGSYSSGSQTDPRGPASGSYRVIRGGCWNYYAIYCRTAVRTYYGPSISSIIFGVRTVLPSGQ